MKCVRYAPSMIAALAACSNAGIARTRVDARPTAAFPTVWEPEEAMMDAGQPSGPAQAPQLVAKEIAAPPEPVMERMPSPDRELVAATPQAGAFAVVFGVERYRDISVTASGARADAEGFAAVVRKTLGLRSDHVRVALDDRASKADFEAALAWAKTTATAGSRLYFFFSGHGAPDAGAGTPYLLPYDADPRFVATTAITFKRVLHELGESRAREVVVFLDSCFSGTGGRSVLPPGARPLVRVQEERPGPNMAIFAAAGGSEIAGPAPRGGGLFSRTLLDAIGTAAGDLDGDGQITLRELADWVTPRVTRAAKTDGRDQHPQLTLGRGADASTWVVAWGLPGR